MPQTERTPVWLVVEGAEGPKKKKACKNCSCGLADELDAEADKKQQQQQSTPSCGNVRALFSSCTRACRPNVNLSVHGLRQYAIK